MLPDSVRERLHQAPQPWQEEDPYGDWMDGQETVRSAHGIKPAELLTRKDCEGLHDILVTEEHAALKALSGHLLEQV